MYTLPKKIDSIVQRDETKVRAALQENQGTCPLYRTDALVRQRDQPSEGYDLDRLVGWGGSTLPLVSLPEAGCMALRDPHCYLQRASQKHPQVESKEQCPVYQRVVELIG